MVGTTGGFLGEIELKAYDFRVKLFSSGIDTDRIAIVAIDEESIKKIGRWPWPRERVAEVVGKLKDDGARVIGLTVLFSEPEESTGLIALKTLKDSFEELSLGGTPQGKTYYEKLNALSAEFDNDAKLADAIKNSANVVLPFAFTGSGIIGGKPPEAPSFIKSGALTALLPPPDETLVLPISGANVLAPIDKLGKVSSSLGHINKYPGIYRDGIDRWEALLIEYGGSYYPSFALSVAANYIGLGNGGLKVDLREGGSIGIGNSTITTDDSLGILINYYDINSSFPVYSFFDVVNGKVSAEAFKDKIVLLGITDIGFGDVAPTPVSPLFTSVERTATVIENLLSGTTIVEPWWSKLTALLAIIIFGLVTTIVLSKTPAMISTIVSASLALVYIGFVLYIFKSQNVWIELIHPPLLVATNFIAITSRRLLFTEKAQIAAESESDEANKLLGLTFQSKGMLEMAFDKFKTLPITDEIKDVLYSLGLDFEKKRNWSQALAVYEKIGDKKFKDIKARLERVTALAAGSGGVVNLKGDSATILNAGGEMPTLGRYEVLSELGRGAMGVVYLGKDPKINREVAIKTVNFDEIEEKMIDTLKERFFREAQSAGTLNHPNILTIFDVGEEGNLAYIAMELIDGKDLEFWTKGDKLLPLKDALLLVATVGDALDFAHTHGIVHGDIKPANIMVTKKNVIKVTDFGIARIQSASQTKTGTVMGTPSYMSPEQVAGDKVDGRSDIFSLGVVLFELLTSKRPFTGESIANIMYNITNKAGTPLSDFRSDLPEFCQALVDKANARDPAKRFQTGGEFSKAIKWCIQKYGTNI